MLLGKHIKFTFFILVCTTFFFCIPKSSSAQLGNFQQRSGKVMTKEERKKYKAERRARRKAPGHSPHKATLYSLILPGLGQAYNKKYWKIPIIYAGLGGLGYLIVTNRNEYIKYRDALAYNPDDPNSVKNEYVDLYSESQLKSGKDLYRRNLDLSFILTGIWWVINMVDAAVDAHLFEFDVSDDLSFRLEPQIQPAFNTYQKPVAGVKLSFRIPYSKH